MGSAISSSSFHCSGTLTSIIEAIQKLRICHADLSVDTKAQVDPAANVVAHLEEGRCCVPVIDKRFVIAATCADWPHPTGVAVRTHANMVLFQELPPGCVVDTRLDNVSHLGYRSVDEAMTCTD